MSGFQAHSCWQNFIHLTYGNTFLLSLLLLEVTHPSSLSQLEHIKSFSCFVSLPVSSASRWRPSVVKELTLQGFGLEKRPPFSHTNGLLSHKPHRMQQQISTQTLNVKTIISKILQTYQSASVFNQGCHSIYHVPWYSPAPAQMQKHLFHFSPACRRQASWSFVLGCQAYYVLVQTLISSSLRGLYVLHSHRTTTYKSI